MKSDSEDSIFGNHIDITTALNNQTKVEIKHPDLGIKDKKFLEVRCGTLYGTLHIDKFLCPGIHCKCIEHEGNLILMKYRKLFLIIYIFRSTYNTTTFYCSSTKRQAKRLER